jgi:3-oxoacyl-[acyl-carrier protein] reductase
LSVKNKTVLITGGSRGIGKRLALGFAAEGARVCLIARSKAELDLAKLEIEHAGGMALRVRADVRDREQVAATVDRLRVQFGVVDILIAAAAIQGPIGPFVSLDPRQWSETVDVNLMGVVHACQAVLPQMIERRSGKIIVIAGGGAAYARPNFTAYAASKTAVVRLVETLAEEVRDNNIQINCMAPGGAYTSMTDEIIRAGDKAGQKELDDAHQVRMTGGVAPAKQVELAMFLASDRSNHISGKLIHVNDDWKKLRDSNMHAEAYTLRRVQKI